MSAHRRRYCCVPERVTAIVKVTPWQPSAALVGMPTTPEMDLDTGVVVLAGTLIARPVTVDSTEILALVAGQFVGSEDVIDPKLAYVNCTA